MASTLYAGTNDGRALFKSTDAPTSWRALNFGFFLEILSLAIDPQDSGTLYVGGLGGIFKTTDGGASWTEVD